MLLALIGGTAEYIEWVISNPILAFLVLLVEYIIIMLLYTQN